ncbi:MAG TPA: prephenate dehydrogenase/arogenate dehydrogenase family protein [Ktedonobacterales bacterium]|nr:prephenate dehydrogenase/arogenate dehydrogenase family protein [Ktedonobacterales bacterium]
MRDGQHAPLFGRVAIIGLGLMGGSLGLALRADGSAGEPLAREVVGYDSAPGVAQRAVARGALDSSCESLAEAVTAADLVVIATPTLAAEQTLRAAATHLAPDVVVTDLCSVKAPLVAVASQALRRPERFVGGHPMAGRERAGIEAASADLYRGARWALTPTPQTAPDAVSRLRALVEALGAEPLELDAVAHDAAVAGISHLPLTLAVALAQMLAEADDWPTMALLAAGGYRDTTRVAAGDPIMGRDILLANREALLARLDAFAGTLGRLRAAIARGDAVEIETTLREARVTRQAWETSRQQPGAEHDSRGL